MKIVRFRKNDQQMEQFGELTPEGIIPFTDGSMKLWQWLESESLLNQSKEKSRSVQQRIREDQVTILPPIDGQEVWAAGVTYQRSKVAREEESEGAARFYDLVYTAARPELFMKATSEKVIGPGGFVRIRKDSKWNVPEPELTLVINSKLKLVGFTIGNDMSSRDIEGENPLYLPQAKIYRGSCALGPVITISEAMPPLDQVTIHLVIKREQKTVFEGNTSISKMARSLESLIDWLGKENEYPRGVLLMTGTGIVPPDSFSLQIGDEISISITNIGTLVNTVGL